VILRNILVFCASLLLAAAHAQTGVELQSAIRALGTTLRVLQITTHPGDEDGGLLLYQARGQGARVTLLTLTRGERGDNGLGIMEPTEQALLRTMEQLSSDAHYGVEQRFTRVVDFGFARTADEVFDRWGGHNTALGDMVRVIRETHPDIIMTPLDMSSPDVTPPEEDGQHQATAILVREAFRAAADAKKFPEQLTDGVEPWQAKRLFALVRSGASSVAFNVAGTVGEVHHYRLIESATGFAMADGAKDFAEGLNYGIASLMSTVVSTAGVSASRASAPTASATAGARGLSREEALQVQSRLKAMSAAAASAEESTGDRANCIAQITEYLRNLHAVEDRILVSHPPAWLRAELATKRKQAERALLLAAGVQVEARLMDDGQGGAAYVLVPGTNFAVQVKVAAGVGASVHVVGMELKPEGGRWAQISANRREWNPGDTHAVFRGRVPADAPFTRPQFLLDSEEDGAYRILDERNATRALPPASLQAIVEIEVEGEVVRASAEVEARDGNALRTVIVAPPMSVIVEPRTQWNRRTNFSYGEIKIRVRSNVAKLQNALLSVHPPSGWRAEPEHEVLDIGRGAEHTYRFFLVQERGGEGRFPVRAVVRWGGAVFDQGYAIVHGADDQIALDFRPSTGTLVSAEMEVSENLEVGYVGVAGDPIPSALRDINVNVTELSREELMQGRLGKFWAIVLGPHAVDVREELAEARTRLLRYAEEGGALVIMAQQDAVRFLSNAPVPYALELGTARVSNEASAVEMIEPHDDLFQDPNEITDEDFRGWSEERGRYFAQSWDAHFEALLRMRDPGQSMQEGSLIRARYGRGSVVYTGLSFVRQLPAGVPGALRLLVNLLSVGAELHR
jgi:LmbE family N-acetylglucosaminyl deacetylase